MNNEEAIILRVQYRHRLRRAALHRRREAEHLYARHRGQPRHPPAMRTELDWLIYNAPREYARMTLDGTLEDYLKRAEGMHGLED